MSESNKTTDNAPNRWIGIDINGLYYSMVQRILDRVALILKQSANSKTEKVNQKGMETEVFIMGWNIMKTHREFYESLPKHLW